MSNIFSSEFLFYINRVNLETVDYIFLYFSLVVTGLGLAFWYLHRRKKKAVNPVATVFHKLKSLNLTIGLLGLVWFGARLEYIRWFGTHFAFLVLMLLGVLWLGKVLWFIYRPYKLQKAEWEKQMLKSKYLNK